MSIPQMDFLILQIENGSETAYKKLFYYYYDDLFRFSYSLVKNRSLAEEAVMDVFTKIWMGRKRIKKIKNMKTYLFQSTRNSTLNMIRKENSIMEVSLSNQDREELLSPEKQLISEENLNTIESVIDKLPLKCKMVLRLLKENDLSRKEVADILDISIKTVDNHISLAISKITKEIKLDRKTLILYWINFMQHNL